VTLIKTLLVNTDNKQTGDKGKTGIIDMGENWCKARDNQGDGLVVEGRRRE